MKLLDFVLQGRRDFFHSASAYSPLPGATFQDNLQTMVYCSAIDYAVCNGIMNKTEEYIPDEEEIQDVVTFFEERALPFIWWSHAKRLEKYDFQYGGMLTGIALDLSESSLAHRASSSQATIKQVQSQADLKVFSELLAVAFGMTEKALSQLLAVNEATMKQGEQVHFLAHLEGQPVGTATLSTSLHSSGIWNLGTLPEYRRIGVGYMLVHAALSEAKKRRYSQVMAILMPKGMAWGIFKRFKFQEVCQFPFYVHGISSASLE